MRHRTLLGATAALVAGVLLTPTTQLVGAQTWHVPIGWAGITTGSEYAIGTDAAQRTGGKGVLGATIKSKVAAPTDVALLQQSIKADNFLDGRVRLTAYVKTEHGQGGAAYVWMRVDGRSGTLSSDYMLKRPIGPGRDWTQYSIVLDVPRNAVGITFGVAQNGGGQLWVDEFSLVRVGKNVPTTGRTGGLYGFPNTPAAARAGRMTKAYLSVPRMPVNLDFEQGTVATRE